MKKKKFTAQRWREELREGVKKKKPKVVKAFVPVGVTGWIIPHLIRRLKSDCIKACDQELTGPWRWRFQIKRVEIRVVEK